MQILTDGRGLVGFIGSDLALPERAEPPLTSGLAVLRDFDVCWRNRMNTSCEGRTVQANELEVRQ